MITSVTVNTAAIDRVIARLAPLTDLSRPAAVAGLVDKEGALYRVIVEDNRRGVLAGTDKDGKPAPPLKYRNAARIQSAPMRGYYRGVQGEGVQGRFKGRAPARAGMLPNNNLTTGQYRKLTGPRLAPRRESSRVIANLRYRRAWFSGGTWYVQAYWAEVRDPKGRSLLPYHFDGTGRAPRYDLRGVRPAGIKAAQNAIRAYFLTRLKQAATP